MALRTVNISGGGGRRIRAELASRDDAVDHGVVMLPGLGYTCAMPAFYYLDELAIGLGAAVLSLAPDYRQDERFGAFPLGDEQRDWLRDDVESGIAALVAMHDVSRLTVDVAGRPVPVTVLGVDAATVPACANADALAFARRTLQGQDVTLVPDPTVPAPAGVVRAYPVLGTQLSYTDAVIMAGWATPAGASRYRAVFDRERAQAQQDRLGMYGPPCRP